MQRQIEYAQLRIVDLAVVQLALQVALQLLAVVLERLVRTFQRAGHVDDLAQLLQIVRYELDFAFELLQVLVFDFGVSGIKQNVYE